jgi:predicted permease
MLSQAAVIFGNVLLPILLIVALGALVQRFHPLHLATLSKLQIYLFVPVFLFVRVTASTLSWAEIAGIAGAVLLAKALLAVPLALVLRRLEVPRETLGVVVLSSAIFNAGNFGIPVGRAGVRDGRRRGPGARGDGEQPDAVGDRLWRPRGAVGPEPPRGPGRLLQAADGLSARARVHAPRRAPAAAVPRRVRARLIADGLVPIALVTLGAQLAQQARWPRWRIIVPVLALKLLALPAITAGVVVALGLWPWPGAMLIVASAGPTAVNTLLMAIEQNGDAELAADCVFWTTLLSAVTVTLVLGIVVALGGQPPGGAATAAP